MGKSIRRDIYLAKAENKAGKDQQVFMSMMLASPYKQHRRAGLKMYNEIQELKKQAKSVEA